MVSSGFDLTLRGWNVKRAYMQQKAAGAYNAIFNKYRDPGTTYAFRVLEGDIVAGGDILLLAFRHLQDLTRQGTDGFDYTYSIEKCHEVLNFSKLCPDVNTGRPLPLALWQEFVLCLSQGWRTSTGERRFHRVNLSVARTNGKTYITNILLSYQYCVVSARKYNQDMAYIAPVTQQSKKGWRYLKTTFYRLKNDKAFNRLFSETATKIGEDVIKAGRNQNQLLRLSHESGQFDSYHFSFAVSDEAADDKRIGLIRENNSKITSGQVQTANSQFWQISSAYSDSNSQFYQDEQLARNSMKHDNERTMEDFLVFNFAQDSEDEVDKPKTWVKSNPILTVAGDSMLHSLIDERDAKKADSSLSDFMTKNMNLWPKATDDKYLNPADIDAAVVDEPPFEIDGRNVYIGFDLSKLADDTAIAFVYPYQQGDETHYFIEQHSWVPTSHTHGDIALKEKQDGISYRGAEQAGYATIAKNRFGYIDEDSVTDWLLNYVEDHDLKPRYFIFDRWSTSDTVEKLQSLDLWPLLPLKQTATTLDKPTIEFRKAIQTGRVHYLADPIITYSLKNAVLVGSSAGVKVDKDRATAKIDAVDAIIDAMSRAIYEFTDYGPDDDGNDKALFAGWTDDQKHDYWHNYSF